MTENIIFLAIIFSLLIGGGFLLCVVDFITFYFFGTSPLFEIEKFLFDKLGGQPKIKPFTYNYECRRCLKVFSISRNQVYLNCPHCGFVNC
jgi:hypothetical protein